MMETIIKGLFIWWIFVFALVALMAVADATEERR
jgi:hypothetical protein